MLSISNKATDMPESPIRKLMPYAEKAKSEGKKVYQLNIGQPDIDSPKEAINLIKSIDLKHIAYSPSEGFTSYRKALAKFYSKETIQIDYKNIMVTTGGSEALSFVLNTCLNPDEEVIIPEPFYANYNGFAKAANISVVPVTSSIKNGFSLPSIKSFEEKISPKTKAILICNPGNPTGCLYSKEDLNLICKIVKKHNLYLISDEVYKEFCYDNNTHHSALDFPAIEQNTIVVDSISKRYNLCGARVGTIITKNKAVFFNCLKFAQARLSPPTLGQIIGECVLKTPKSYFKNLLEEYNQRRLLLVEGLNKITGVICPPPKGAFYAIAELPVKDAEDFCIWLLDSFSYENQTVMIAPAEGFYSTKGLGKKEVRIAYVLEEEALKKALICIEKALEKYED